MKKVKILVDVFFVVLLLLSVIVTTASYINRNTFAWISGILLVLGLVFNWMLIKKEFNKKSEEEN